MWGLHPKLELGAPELSIEEKSALGIAPDRLALKVQFLSESLRQAGLRKNDVIVSFDGSDANETSLGLNVRVRLNYQPGTKVPIVVLRDGQRVELTLPLG
jgi:serine protease Do